MANRGPAALFALISTLIATVSLVGARSTARNLPWNPVLEELRNLTQPGVLFGAAGSPRVQQMMAEARDYLTTRGRSGSSAQWTWGSYRERGPLGTGACPVRLGSGPPVCRGWGRGARPRARWCRSNCSA